MDRIVLEFLRDVKTIVDEGLPFYDTDVCEAVLHAIEEGYIERRPGYVLP